jgi:CHASE3 domain sensor protein
MRKWEGNMQREAARRRNGKAAVTFVVMILIAVVILGYLFTKGANNATNAQQAAITRQVNARIATDTAPQYTPGHYYP